MKDTLAQKETAIKPKVYSRLTKSEPVVTKSILIILNLLQDQMKQTQNTP